MERITAYGTTMGGALTGGDLGQREALTKRMEHGASTSQECEGCSSRAVVESVVDAGVERAEAGEGKSRCETRLIGLRLGTGSQAVGARSRSASKAK